MDKKQKVFGRFICMMDLAYCQFHVWKTLQNKAFNGVFSNYNYFWKQVSDALLNSSTVGLTKLVEKQSKLDQEVISIFFLLEFGIENAAVVIEKLRKLRNKIIMHNDVKTILEADNFFKELSLNYGDIEDLFDEIIKVLDRIKQNFSNSTDFSNRYSEMKVKCEKDTINLIDKLTPGIELD